MFMMIIDIDQYCTRTSKGIITCELFMTRTKDSHIDNMKQRWLFDSVRSSQPKLHLKASMFVCTFRHESILNFPVDIKLGRWCENSHCPEVHFLLRTLFVLFLHSCHLVYLQCTAE